MITGHSRGLGAALARHHLQLGDTVYAMARGTLEHESRRLHQRHADFSEPQTLPSILQRLLPDTLAVDRVYLNAGVLGPIAAMSDTDLAELRDVMDVNVWANKEILDTLNARNPAVKQIILISSGAAIRGNFGWGAYALSKAALNMLAQLYAHEMPDCQLVALAPGLVDTDMQAQLRNQSAREFPSLKRLHEAAGSAAMPSADIAAARIVSCLAQLTDHPSGQFLDLRDL